MVELTIGAIFMVIGAFVSIMFVSAGETGLVLFGLIFFAAGLLVFVKGFKQKLKDKKTEKNGEICFGRIKETKGNGTSVNGVEYQDAYIYTYIPSLNTVKLMKENIGAKYQDYLAGKYVKLKYFEDDINIIGCVPKEQVPQNQLAEIEKYTDINPGFIYNVESSNTPLQPMDMPSNGVSYSWNNDNNNNNQN